MKNYTDLDQSRKLMEFLPIESADMYYKYVLPKSDIIIHIPEFGNPIDSLKWYNEGYTFRGKREPITLSEYCIPCWSLTALMDVLDRGALFKTPKGWACQTYIEYEAITSDYYSNPIDACVAMIEKLHEQKLL